MARLFARPSHPFFIRLKDNQLAQWGTQKKPLKDFFNHLPANEERHLYKMIAQCALTLVGKRLKTGEFLIVCSNTSHPCKILSTYRRRWDIESLFKNMKSQGFNLEKTHMKDLVRLAKLMAVVSMATLITCLMGLTQKTPFKKTVNSPLHSLFTRGLRVIQNLIDHSPPLLERLIHSAERGLLKNEG